MYAMSGRAIAFGLGGVWKERGWFRIGVSIQGRRENAELLSVFQEVEDPQAQRSDDFLLDMIRGVRRHE